MKLSSLLIPTLAFVLSTSCSKNEKQNPLDELDPKDPAAAAQIKKFDEEYEEATGMKPFIPSVKGACRYTDCPVFAMIDKESQTLTLYINGTVEDVWDVSTGVANGYETPNFNTNPNGRIYTKYNSRKYPGGDYQGMGNMPYAVFISGYYAIHGTGQISRLGRKASHGCIRIHPDNAKLFNELVRTYGTKNVWITVQ